MNRKQLIEWLKHSITYLIENGCTDLIPHKVLSHGFMEWSRLVPDELKWRGRDTEARDDFTFDTYMKILYERFFLLVKKEALDEVHDKISPWTIESLKQAGWREYLKD
jgi:hypothetical protein